MVSKKLEKQFKYHGSKQKSTHPNNKYSRNIHEISRNIQQ